MNTVFRIALVGSILLFASARVYSQIEVGIASTDITPVVGVDSLIGMNGKLGVVTNVHDPLRASVIVFKQKDTRVALVSLELLAIENKYLNAIREGIEQATGISNVITSLTHTHGSGSLTPEFSEKVVKLVIATVERANEVLEPALVGFGRGQVDESYNRRLVKSDGTVEMLWGNKDRVPTAPLDNEVGVISIRRVSDYSTIATLVNYNAHPVISMNFEELVVSGDYPGALVRKLDEKLGGSSFFFLGAAGDINAYDAGIFAEESEERVFSGIDRVAEVLAAEVARISGEIDEFEPELQLSFATTTMDMSMRREGPNAEKSQPIEISTFLLGQNLAFVGIPGEPFVELGLDLKHRSPVDLTFILSYGNGHFWYFPTIEAAAQGGYGASSATTLEVGAGERMVDQAVVNLYYQLGLIKELPPE